MIRRDEGSSLVEVVLVGFLLMVPVIWLLGVLADAHRGALAATAAAREAGTDAARATSLGEADAAIDNAVARAFRDHGLDPADADVSWAPAPRLERGGALEVEVAYEVRVFGLPLIGSLSRPSLQVTARHMARIDPYRSRP